VSRQRFFVLPDVGGNAPDIEPSQNLNNSLTMTSTDISGGNLAILVDGLVAYLQERRNRHASPPASTVPQNLARVFDAFGDHLVALMLVARSDDDVASSEREVILRYCETRARSKGLELTPEESDALEVYLRRFRPSLPQTISAIEAIERLKHAPQDEIASFIAAARAVVEADGVVRLQEALYLADLQRDLHSP